MRDHPNPQDSQTRLRESFGRGLATYHDAAIAQKQIANRLVAHLLQARGTAAFGRVFEFGCGTGHLTQALLDHAQVNALCLNDLVPDAEGPARSLGQAHCAHVQFLPGAVEQLTLPGAQDLVMSASTLQWVQDGPQTLDRVARSLAPGGWMALSTFGTSHFRELVQLGSDAAAPNYSDAETLAGWLPQGFDLITLEQAPIVLHFDTAQQLLRHLRDTGVNARSGQQWSRGKLAEFDARYRALFEENSQLPLTYDTVWLIARKV